MKKLICRIFHKKYHYKRFFCDGVAFGYRAGECIKCGHRWNGGRLAINYNTQEIKILLDNEIIPGGWKWCDHRF